MSSLVTGIVKCGAWIVSCIPDDTVEELKAEARAQAMEDAVNAGIYEMAEEEAKAQIRGLLSEVGDFQIEFM